VAGGQGIADVPGTGGCQPTPRSAALPKLRLAFVQRHRTVHQGIDAETPLGLPGCLKCTPGVVVPRPGQAGGRTRTCMAAASDGQGGPVPDHQVPPKCRQRWGVVAAWLTIVVQTGARLGVPETIHLRQRNNTGLSYTGWKVRRGLILSTYTTFDPAFTR